MADLQLEDRQSDGPLRGLKSASAPKKAVKAREQKLGATARSFAILDYVASSPTPVEVLDIIANATLVGDIPGVMA